jgi:1-acyl-sn-glycerol-3-phosphate acyltransferase
MRFLRRIIVGLVKIITGANAVFLDEEPSTPPLRLYFANHGSHLDFATVYASLPPHLRERTRPVAARDYWGRNRFTRFLASTLANALLISRDIITRKENPVEQMADALREGCSLILFPEGTRSLDGEVHEFKPGLYHLAKKVAGLELVPVYLQNLNRMLPKGQFLPIPLISTVVFGPPIKLGDHEPKMEFLKRARQCLLNLVPSAHT